MKLKFTLILIFLCSMLFSQSDVESAYIASFGSVSINDQLYNQVSFKPEFAIGKVGLGLDFYFYFDEDGNLYDRDWDFSTFETSLKTIVDKIYYIRYGQPIDPIYFKIGALPEQTMGHGILVKDYSNDIDYPQIRRIGFDFRSTFSGFRLELLHSDIKEFSHAGLLGLRTVFPLANRIDMGFSVVTDLDQISGLIDTDKDSYPDYVDAFPDNGDWWHDYESTISEIELACDNNDADCPSSDVGTTVAFLQQVIDDDEGNLENVLSEDNISGVAIDLTYDINDKITMFSEFSQLSGNTNNPYSNQQDFDTKLGYGFIPIGLKVNFNSVLFTIDYRQSAENFIFHYWDKNYEHNRVMIANDEPVTKESLLYQYGKQKGANIGFIANISKYLKFSVDYLYMKGDTWDLSQSTYTNDKNNSLYSKLEIDTSMIPKVDIAEIFYQQTNTKNPFKFEVNENTLFGYNIGISLASNLSLMLKGRKTYVCDNDDCTAVKNTQIETSAYF